jgi:hypothetical protein
MQTNSSVIKDCCWAGNDDGTSKGTLTIEFVNGSMYDYKNVTRETFEEFKHAPSMGEYFAKNIRGLYASEKL